MTWQDWTIAIAGLLFSYSLVPTAVYNYQKKQCEVTYQTLLVSILGLLGCIVAYASLGLQIAATTTFLTCCSWITLLVQKIMYQDYESKTNRNRSG